MKLIKPRLLSASVIPMAAAAGLAIGGGVVTATPSHAKGVAQDLSAEMPAAKARAGGLQLAACSPCKAKNPCNPCAPKNPCSAKNPCGAKSK